MTLIQLYNELDTDNVELDFFKMKETEAFSMPGIIILDTDKIKNLSDEKVKIAHEFGHCKTLSFYNANNHLDIMGKHEHRANKCAIKMLVTEDELHDAVKQGNTEIWQLADYFSVTEDFMRKIVNYYEGLEL